MTRNSGNCCRFFVSEEPCRLLVRYPNIIFGLHATLCVILLWKGGTQTNWLKFLKLQPCLSVFPFYCTSSMLEEQLYLHSEQQHRRGNCIGNPTLRVWCLSYFQGPWKKVIISTRRCSSSRCVQFSTMAWKDVHWEYEVRHSWWRYLSSPVVHANHQLFIFGAFDTRNASCDPSVLVGASLAPKTVYPPPLPFRARRYLK